MPAASQELALLRLRASARDTSSCLKRGAIAHSTQSNLIPIATPPNEAYTIYLSFSPKSYCDDPCGYGLCRHPGYQILRFGVNRDCLYSQGKVYVYCTEAGLNS
jgi:hypothetical protein